MNRLAYAVLMACSLVLTGCKDETAQNLTPVDMTAESLGHFCQMNLLEHPGPKAQIHLEGMPGAPLYFSQVRDALAYQRLPEQSLPMLALYVNDMGAPGATWDVPGDGNWIVADTAFYVLGSQRDGGMGAPETIPFADRKAAEAFANAEGGTVLTFDAIPEDAVLAPVDMSADMNPDHSDGGEDDFADRLRAIHQN